MKTCQTVKTANICSWITINILPRGYIYLSPLNLKFQIRRNSPPRQPPLEKKPCPRMGCGMHVTFRYMLNCFVHQKTQTIFLSVAIKALQNGQKSISQETLDDLFLGEKY